MKKPNLKPKLTAKTYKAKLQRFAKTCDVVYYDNGCLRFDLNLMHLHKLGKCPDLSNTYEISAFNGNIVLDADIVHGAVESFEITLPNGIFAYNITNDADMLKFIKNTDICNSKGKPSTSLCDWLDEDELYCDDTRNIQPDLFDEALRLLKLYLDRVVKHTFVSTLKSVEHKIVSAKGAFTMWKKVNISRNRCAVAKLQVPANAKRVQIEPETFKIRVSEAKVLGFYDLTGTLLTNVKHATSLHDSKFKYTVNTVAKPTKPFETRQIQCAAGIHGFMQFEDAAHY